MRAENKIKRLLAEYARKIACRHLVMGAMGNISVRIDKTVWIKKAGAWLERAKPKDFIAIDRKSSKVKSGQLPSKEVSLHLGCYTARADIGAVVHTHPLMATALASAGVNLNRSLHRLRQSIGSEIKVLGYYPVGSKRLAAEVQRASKRVNAVLLANHGLVTVGKDMPEAYQRTILIEEGAKKILATLRQK